MRYYPLFLNVRSRRCVVVGGGNVAERKVRMLLRAGAAVEVISPELTARLARLQREGKIIVTARSYKPGELGRRSNAQPAPLLVFAATSDPETQQAVARDAETHRILVNIADDSERSTFLVPASYAQGDLQVAISTSGASPALARLLRRELQASLGRRYRAYLTFLRGARTQVRQSVAAQSRRARILSRVARHLVDWYRVGGRKRAHHELNRLIRKARVQVRQHGPNRRRTLTVGEFTQT